MATTNLEKYRKDLKSLLEEGRQALQSLHRDAIDRKEWRRQLSKGGWSTDEIDELEVTLKPFRSAYHHWYSEALVVVKQLLPDRLADFIRLYERPKSRRELDYETYRIEDACQGLEFTRGDEMVVDMSAGIPLFQQQLAILEAIEKRFSSSLFDIKQLVQADLFDSELDAARELVKNKFARGAGAIAGVVLEGHLKQVCDNHKIPKKSGTISVLNDALKAADVIELSQSRQIQFLADIRNKCGHRNTAEPTVEEVEDLINGVDKIIKTVF